MGLPFSRMVDFANAWFDKYYIDEKTKSWKIYQSQEETIHCDENRIIFILDLLNPQLQKVWETVTFREFLSEQSCPDEVYFYLHCRYLLFKGPMLQYTKNYFEVVSYVTVAQAEALVDLMMKNYDSFNTILIKKQIKEKIHQNNPKGLQLIDSGFVLRVMLEFYRIERKNRYRLLKEAFVSSSTLNANGKFSVPFYNFRKIMNLSYPECAALEVSTLYRECYSLGQGQVTVDTFYTLAAESGLFIRQMKLPSFLVPQPVFAPSQDAQQPPEFTTDDANKGYELFLNFYGSLGRIQSVMLRQALTLGVEPIATELQLLQKTIDARFNVDADQFQGKHLLFVLQRLFQIFLQTRNVLVQKEHFSRTPLFDVHEIMQTDFENCQRQLQMVCQLEQRDKELADFQNKKVKRLQSYILNKIKGFYSFVGSLLSANLKKTVKKTQQKHNNAAKTENKK